MHFQVAALEVAVHGGTKISDKEFEISTEMLMRQLLKLDSIEAEGMARAQRKAEVCTQYFFQYAVTPALHVCSMQIASSIASSHPSTQILGCLWC